MRPEWTAKRTDASLVREICGVREPDTHKGNYGRVLLVCGAEGYTGAPYLAAQAALRTGAGLIFTAVPQSVYPIVAAKLHEPMVLPMPDRDGKLSLQALPKLLELLKTADACLIGPGLGQNQELRELVFALIKACKCPLVLDADGINAVAGHMDVLREIAYPIIMTPHEGEFRRLTKDTEHDRVGGAVAFSKKSGVIILRKGHETVITDGKSSYINKTGNAGMATGGSGDVLSGILVSLLGQGVPALKAAAAAAWLHGTAGDLAAQKLGQYAMAPTDLIEQLSRLLP